jgi:CubicO group peptidase (beta-lactamase class C family)
LILQEGEWQGGRVLPAALVRRCSKPASAAFLGYGVGFWLNGPVGGSYQPGEDRVPMPEAVRARWLQGGKYAPDVPDDMFFASGAGSMKMFILPSHDLVVVKLGGESDDNRFLGLLVGARAPGSIGEHGGRT